ncbi:23S rRNA (cytidine2498-2'-O)-methyltransferase [Humidesulfovibrio mexicanus]|uniref:23S rRNA (Cytidine2498-2'-O)-methyltransferase n=2 Tax=Humidesulfovibrio mexicanus TaxID=147047 RepID=A0A238ZGW6_9BACT|nr:23S rRNA (cytidine2498-2'-O)-methyltransferase [Humidesulfovibrio mexicanus]
MSVDWLHSLPVALPRWMRDGVFTGYLAAPGFLPELLADLDVSGSAGPEHMVFGDLVFVRRAPCSAPAWAQNVWRNARLLAAPSIGQGARALRDIQRNWWPHPVRLARRAALIAEKLPRVSARPQVFGQPAPTAPLGSFTLWDEQTVIAASDCSSPYPDGQARFVEDRESAPSRAYLKLWEAFTLLGVQPACGELCLDFGSSPGGWTWVLASLGARVFSVDKAPLDPRISAMPQVEHCIGSGFGLEPRTAGGPGARVDWLCSDMACYPARLLELVTRWLDADACRNFVCTLKCQGEGDRETIRTFAEIPGARVMHLAHNKHELTWALIR